MHVQREHARHMRNGLGVCLSNVALCESKAAQFKGLITPAIRFRAAGTLSLTPHSQYPRAERGRERERMMDGWRKERRRRRRA